MSHINEALRKAQKDRDAHSLEYTGFLSSRKEEKRTFWRRALLWSSVLLILILLAFTSYSWWDSRGQKTLEPADKKALATRPKAGRVATVKPSPPKSRGRKPLNLRLLGVQRILRKKPLPVQENLSKVRPGVPKHSMKRRSVFTKGAASRMRNGFIRKPSDWTLGTWMH
jgi:hypothetical protein